MSYLSDFFADSRQFLYFQADADGNIYKANSLFLHYAGLPESQQTRFPVSTVLSQGELLRFLSHIRECMTTPGCKKRITLCMVNTREPLCLDWECSAWQDPDGGRVLTEAIAAVPPVGYLATERHMALEKSAEGLWMFVTDVPVELNQDPDKVISSWKENGYLVECNDNLARMYGYEKAEDLIGARARDMLDFSNPRLLEEFSQFIRNGFATATVETREFDRNGHVKYFQNRMTGIVENGKMSRVWGTQQDITAQRVAEEKLRESELFYRNLFVNSQDGILRVDAQGIITFASPSITPILGYEIGEMTGHSCFSFVHPNDVNLAKEALTTEIQNATTIEFISVRVKKKDGDWLWCIVRGHNLLENPQIQGVVVTFYNDTFRKKTEEALMESETRFRRQATILHNVNDIIVTTDLDRVVTSWNHVVEKMTGISAEAAIGKPFRYVIETEYFPYTNEQVISIVSSQGIWKGEVSFMGADGEKKYLLTTISLLRDDEGKRIGLLGVGKDITESKKTTAKLEESELFYRNLITHSLDGIVLTDKEGNIRYCSPSIRKISGYDIAELLGRKIFEFVHPDDRTFSFSAFEEEVRKESKVSYLSMRLLHSSGEWVWCTVRGHNLLDNPVFNSFIIYFTNDSKRKAIEDQLRESESRFRNLIQHVRQGVILQDENGRMIIANQAALDLLGVTKEQLLGTDSMDPRWNVIHEDGSDFPGHTHPVPMALQTGKPVRDVVMGVYRPLAGDRVWLLVNAEPITGEDGKVGSVVCSFTDITEQKKLAQQLIDQEIQEQKQITQATIDAQEKERREIGKELHDNINQHLNTTRLYLEVAREKAEGEIKEMIQLAHKNLSGIVHEIRQLSQSLVPPTLGDLGLVESIQDLCDGLRRSHKFVIDFQYRHFQEDHIPGNLRLSLFRIIQEKISNIIRHSEASKIAIRLQSDAEHIFLTIIDNGIGFDPSVTKEGLGLGNIRTRTELFNGKMHIKTAPGEGCELSVTIPFHQEPVGES